MSVSASLTVVGVGDIMLGDGIQRIRRGVRAAWEGRDSAAFLAHLKPVFSEADLTLGNLECMLGEVDAHDPLKMIYKGSPAHVPALKSIGFTHLSLANNHILEQGLAVAEQTRQTVESAGIVTCCGVNPKRCILKDQVVDIFTYNLIHDTPHHDFYRDRVASEDLEAIRQSDAAVKIICIHWGDEHSLYPSPDQIELGRQLVDHGACLVLGHHPHVIQGIETYRGAVIAYSLGNFIFDMNWSERTRSAFILKAEIEPGKSVRFAKIPFRQDDAFIPRLTAVSRDHDLLDQQVLFYQGDNDTYQAYRKKKLNKSRLRAILHLLSRFYQVDYKTWEVLIGKRLRGFSHR